VTGGTGKAAALAPGVRLRMAAHLPGPFEIPGPALVHELRCAIEDADIVHVHSVWNGTSSAAQRICVHQSKPFVVSPRGMLDAHNVKSKRMLKSLYLRIFERQGLESANAWHFLDHAERKGMRWFSTILRRPSCVLPNGVEVDKIRSAAELGGEYAKSVFQSRISLVYLGRLHPIKRIHLQLHTIAVLKQKAIEAHLYLVGPDDGMERRLRELAGRLNISEWVHFLGAVDDERRYQLLREATAVLLTSRYECNSRTAAEAVAAGGVLLATRQCHVGSLVTEGAAIALNPDPRLFASCVEQLVKNTTVGTEQRRRAVRYAQGRLRWEGIAQDMLRFYGDVLGRI
jgi:glycosyltransferase involved in cell wall biosynthesis